MNQIKENSEDRAYRLIAESLTKFYKPGDYLFERALTHDLGMSRTPIAIALNRLISEGLLKKHPKKGCYIPKVNSQDAQDVFAIRKVLEIEAVRILVLRQDADVFAMLQTNIDEATAVVRHDDYEVSYSLDLKFHNALAVYSYNNYLYEAWKRTFMRCNMYTRYFRNNLQQNQFLKENLLHDHSEVLEAMKNNDADCAVACMSKHFDHIVSYMTVSTLLHENV